jgi:hypothetical protein
VKGKESRREANRSAVELGRRAPRRRKERTNRLDVDGREQILENSGHELELLVLASESREDELL